ncbi:MAG: hypothetical protein LBS35_13860 [Synergistaceae bacterium]|jgi:hypothetical protein|nr:hypothetical protein [Synergistaceae bacterium]
MFRRALASVATIFINRLAGHYGRVKKAFRLRVKLSVSGLLVIMAAAWLLAPDIMAIFRRGMKQ